jgi:RimJ/RimL family protein N-acetyltransferase
MPEVAIRPALSSDLPALIDIAPFYQTGRVWQMDRNFTEGQFVIHFREIRLPRPVKVEYPRHLSQIFNEHWLENQNFLVAAIGPELVGYCRISLTTAPKTLWVQDLVVAEYHRQKGIGTALVVAAQDWGAERGARRMTVEMQSKNYAAIQLMRKLGFELSGYNDQYYLNQDIALFFTGWLR